MSIRSFWLALCLAVTLAACNTTTAEPIQSQPGISVDITSSTCPSSIIKVGDQVRWTNIDQVEHIVQAEASDGSTLFDSGTLNPGDSFEFVFLEAGTYAYRCSTDGDFTGRITVEP